MGSFSLLRCHTFLNVLFPFFVIVGSSPSRLPPYSCGKPFHHPPAPCRTCSASLKFFCCLSLATTKDYVLSPISLFIALRFFSSAFFCISQYYMGKRRHYQPLVSLRLEGKERSSQTLSVYLTNKAPASCWCFDFFFSLSLPLQHSSFSSK